MEQSDREAADKSYATALEVAQAEFDELQPQLSKLNTRVANLKRAVQSLSGLLGKPVDERFEFKPMPSAGRATPQPPTTSNIPRISYHKA